MNSIMIGGLLQLFYICIPFALFIAWLLYDRYLEGPRFLKRMMPYFVFLKSKYNAKYPVVIYKRIETNFPEIMPSDKKNLVIFSTEENIVITKMNDASFEYFIPRQNITDVRYTYFEGRDYYWIRLTFAKNLYIEFETMPLIYYSRSFVEQNRGIISAEGLIKELLTIKNPSSKKYF